MIMSGSSVGRPERLISALKWAPRLRGPVLRRPRLTLACGALEIMGQPSPAAAANKQTNSAGRARR